MAIYKTVSSKEIVRKVMRDINPEGGDWIHDAIEWIGEALEHIGASAQLESKLCTVYVKDHKCALPADLYYVEQVGTSNYPNRESTTSEILELTREVKGLNSTYTSVRDDLNSKVTKATDGTYTSVLTKSDVATYNTIAKTTDNDLRDLNARIVVLENTLMGGQTMQNVETLQYCTSTMNAGRECADCANEGPDCYFIENDHIKTSFSDGMLCMSYKAMPTDPDCYPLVPDDISYREAMFWYIYKKMLLGGMRKDNGIQYDFADQKWKYYCTQARNAAVFPDLDRWENFMNQWVRLIPNINRHSFTFDNLAEREDIYRGQYNTYGR